MSGSRSVVRGRVKFLSRALRVAGEQLNKNERMRTKTGRFGKGLEKALKAKSLAGFSSMDAGGNGNEWAGDAMKTNRAARVGACGAIV